MAEAPLYFGALPVLNYHHVHDGPDESFRVTPEQLRDHLAYLSAAGYTPIHLDRLISADGDNDLPAKPVLITFDDGYENFASHAWPILRELGVPCVLFVLSGFIGGWNDWDRLRRSRYRHLDADELRQLRDEGVAFGSHSRSHPVLNWLPAERLRSEVHESASELEAVLSVPIRAFAYPGGHVNRRVCRTVADRYELAFATTASTGARLDHPHRIPRIDASFCRDVGTFGLSVAGSSQRPS